jgi:hypothetical protein
MVLNQSMAFYYSVSMFSLAPGILFDKNGAPGSLSSSVVRQRVGIDGERFE